MLCANTEGIFRIIQSIPSPKAEPFKRWLAKVGYEREEIPPCPPFIKGGGTSHETGTSPSLRKGDLFQLLPKELIQCVNIVAT